MTAYEAFEYEEPREAYEWEQPELNEAYEWEQPELNEANELHEALEMQLAQELLEVTNEAELEEFLGKLVRRVARGAGTFMRSSVGRAVGGVLRNVAKTALPMVGSALGSLVAPGLGTAIGGRLGSMAAGLLEAEELESMGEAEAEMEAARRYVRWAGGTVRTAMRSPYGVPPRLVARSAAVASARRYAPALIRPSYGRVSPWRGRRSGNRGAWGFPQAPVQQGGCTCGQGASDQWGAQADEPGYDDDAQEMYETHESHEAMEALESQELSRPGGSRGGGRWYRRGNRIVLVGA